MTSKYKFLAFLLAIAIAIILTNRYTLMLLYPKTCTVTSLDSEYDMVICVDSNGHQWTFAGIEDWEVGDICSMIMNSKGTPNIYDDSIVNVRYDGIKGE